MAQCVADLGGTLHEQFYALNHEGDEALLADPPSPMLKLLPDLRELKRKAHESYMRRYGLPVEMPAIVKRADLISAATEKRDLMPPTPEGAEWTCAEDPLAERIEHTPYDPALVLRLQVAVPRRANRPCDRDATNTWPSR